MLLYRQESTPSFPNGQTQAMVDDEELKERLVSIKTEHRDLDDAIEALMRDGKYNQLQVQRLKKKKLQLKDEISKLEDILLPDIIA
jgi:hypothetical protein